MISSVIVFLLFLQQVTRIQDVPLLPTVSLPPTVCLLRIEFRPQNVSLARDTPSVQHVHALLFYPELSSLAVRRGKSLRAASVPQSSFSCGSPYLISFGRLAKFHGKSDSATAANA